MGNRLSVAILTSAIVMFLVLYVCDVKQWITTPLSPYGMTHWIPELFTIFLVGRWLVDKFSKTTILTIGICIALYPALTYILMNRAALGLGTSSIFVGTLLMGIWSKVRKAS